MTAPTWTDRSERRLTRESFGALLGNQIPAIRIPGFATADECARFSAAVKAGPMKYYSVARRIGYIGMAQYEYRWNTPKKRYFEAGLGRYFAGIVRSASEGVALHADFAPFNSPAYCIGQIDTQLGWNFFNTRNPHEIAGGPPVAGRDRISIGSFIGRMPDGSFGLWA